MVQNQKSGKWKLKNSLNYFYERPELIFLKIKKLKT